MGEIHMEKGERIDDIGFGDFKIIQKPEEFCYGIDAVILADFAASFEKGRKEKVAFDLGTGTGIIPIILTHKLENSFIHGIEVQEESYLRAQKNIELNHIEDRVNFIKGNIIDIDKKYFDSADFVVSNPPYMEGESGLKNANQAKTIARHEIFASLDEFLYIASKLLKNKGSLYMVHRPSRLVDLLHFGRMFGLEAKTIRFVSPRTGGIPNIVLIQFVKNGGRELKFMEELIVYNGEEYSDEIKRIYEK